MSRTSDWWADEMQRAGELEGTAKDAEYDAWLASLASMEDERFCRTAASAPRTVGTPPTDEELHDFECRQAAKLRGYAGLGPGVVLHKVVS